jgi:hypothetical protein
MAATLMVVRRAKIVGFELRRRPFTVTVDGKEAASLEIHGTAEIDIEPGQHTLHIQSGRYSSRTVTFEVAGDSVATFSCHSPQLWPVYLASVIVPSLGISLHRE